MNNMLYKDKLIELRENKNLKQREVANLINTDRSVYGRYEKEYQIIPIKHLNTICNYFDVSLDYIFSFSKNINYKYAKQNIDKNIMGIKLKEFRKENKITQDKLAEFLKTSQSTIADYERGKNYIPTPFLYTICKKYNISADYLLGKIDHPKYLK